MLTSSALWYAYIHIWSVQLHADQLCTVMCVVSLNICFCITFYDTQTMAHLKQLLDTINVTYTEKIFESENGIAELGPEPFVSKEEQNHFDNLRLVILLSCHSIPSTGSQHQNIYHCNLCCACKTTAVWGTPNYSNKSVVKLYQACWHVHFPLLHSDPCPTHRHTIVAFTIPVTCSLLLHGMLRIGG